MSKQVRRICDVCGGDLTHYNYYKFKQKGWYWDGTPNSYKLEMCESCYEEFKRYIQNKKLVEPKPPKGRTAMQDF